MLPIFPILEPTLLLARAARFVLYPGSTLSVMDAMECLETGLEIATRFEMKWDEALLNYYLAKFMPSALLPGKGDTLYIQKEVAHKASDLFAKLGNPRYSRAGLQIPLHELLPTS